MWCSHVFCCKLLFIINALSRVLWKLNSWHILLLCSCLQSRTVNDVSRWERKVEFIEICLLAANIPHLYQMSAAKTVKFCHKIVPLIIPEILSACGGRKLWITEIVNCFMGNSCSEYLWVSIVWVEHKISELWERRKCRVMNNQQHQC